MFLNADGRLTETGHISRCPAGSSRWWWVRRPGRPDRQTGRQFLGRYQQRHVGVYGCGHATLKLSTEIFKRDSCPETSLVIAKFHYTDTDFFAAKLRWVRAGPFGSMSVSVSGPCPCQCSGI